MIDLNGHRIISTWADSTGVYANDFIAGGNTNLIVCNGTIDCKGRGVWMPNARNSRVENVHVREADSATANYGVGIRVGSNSVVTGCNVETCQVSGIVTGASASIRDCVATNAGINGIVAGNDSNLLRCTSTGSTGHNFVVGNSCIVDRCVGSSSQTGSGFLTGVNCIVSGCTARVNALYGIQAGGQNVLENNAINANASGVLLQSQSICRNNLIDFHNATGARGVVAYSECMIDDNLFTRNYFGAHCLEINTIFRRNYFRGYTLLTETLGSNFLPTVQKTALGTSSNPHANVI